MKVLDLFAGLGGWSSAFKERGHQVITLDLDPQFHTDIIADVLSLTSKDLEDYDVILASPPCESFSVASIGTHWGKQRTPKTEQAKLHVKLAKHTYHLLINSKAILWVMENPRGMMRKVIATPSTTVTYCQYGFRYMKPTDLWYNGSIGLKKKCSPGSSCHQSAPRGSRTGVQGIKNTPERSLVPYQLSLAICLEAEKRLSQTSLKI